MAWNLKVVRKSVRQLILAQRAAQRQLDGATQQQSQICRASLDAPRSAVDELATSVPPASEPDCSEPGRCSAASAYDVLPRSLPCHVPPESSPTGWIDEGSFVMPLPTSWDELEDNLARIR